jgi:AcrR family transcriptional regulator
MAAPARTRLQLDERRAQLVELGRALFNQHAYDELSIDDIARAAGISKGLLYHYFPSKRAFYVATVRVAADEMAELTDPGEGPATPEARLDAGLEAYLAYVEANARAFAHLLSGGIGADREVAEIVEATRERIAQRLAQNLGRDRVIASDQADSPVLRLALRGWIGFVEAASLDWVHGRATGREDLKRLLAATLIATLQIVPTMHGLAAAPAAATGRAAKKPAGGKR